MRIGGRTRLFITRDLVSGLMETETALSIRPVARRYCPSCHHSAFDGLHRWLRLCRSHRPGGKTVWN